jgi:Na+/phosphate symporter
MDLSLVSNDVVVEAQLSEAEETKRQKVLEYIRSLKAIEDAIEPYAEQKRELKAEFKEQGWLSGDEISLAVKAYRMLKKDQDIDELVEMFNFLRGEK